MKLGSEENKKKTFLSTCKKRTFNISLINIQGLTKPKLLELETLMRKNCDILCLTETQQKYDKLEFAQGIKNIANMRNKNDKKGGGLLIMYKNTNLIELQKVQTKCSDILHVVGKIMNEKVRLIVVYFSVVKKEDDRKRNLQMKKEVEKYWK